jgi:hypothetical protein
MFKVIAVCGHGDTFRIASGAGKTFRMLSKLPAQAPTRTPWQAADSASGRQAGGMQRQQFALGPSRHKFGSATGA